MRTDRRTDRYDANKLFSKFCKKTPKNGPDSAALAQIPAAFSSDVSVKF